MFNFTTLFKLKQKAENISDIWIFIIFRFKTHLIQEQLIQVIKYFSKYFSIAKIFVNVADNVHTSERWTSDCYKFSLHNHSYFKLRSSNAW